MFFLVNEDNPHAKTLMLKMAQEAKPGALIRCTDEEFEASKTCFTPISMGNEDSRLVEVDHNKTYVLFANDMKLNIDDVAALNDSMGLNIGIVRVAE